MLIPTIHFAGNCNEVIEFYKAAVGAKMKEIAYAKDAPPNTGMEGFPPNFVMHAEMEIFGTVVAMSDGCEKPPMEDNHTFMLVFNSEDEVRGVFEKLSQGGKITTPLGSQFWAKLYGGLTDRFGVHWQVSTNQ